MKLIIRKYAINNIKINAEDEDGCSCDYNDIIDNYKISPFNFYKAFVKNNATWISYEGYYKFNNVEDAQKTIDEIESYLMMKKLTE